MSVPTLPHDPPSSYEEDPELRIEGRLRHLEDMVEHGNREGRRAGRAFMLFAVIALVVAVANLIAVATKLQGDSTATPAKAPAAAPVAASKVDVGLTEFKVAPSSTAGKAGKVTFAVSNKGSVTHEFVVLKTNKPAADLLKGARADESGNVGETGDLAAGASKTITLPLQAGHYALICNLPGHYKAGQYADFTVK